jgi:hypothetical protein
VKTDDDVIHHTQALESHEDTEERGFGNMDMSFFFQKYTQKKQDTEGSFHTKTQPSTAAAKPT